MLNDLRIEALAQGCVSCSKPLKHGHRVLTAYHLSELRSFAQQVELGLLGAGARNFWTHVECENPDLEKGTWAMHPDIHHCVRCGDSLSKKDVVNPVFRVEDPNMVNPSDPADRGVALGDRIYFMHADCKNPALTKGSSILITG